VAENIKWNLKLQKLKTRKLKMPQSLNNQIEIGKSETKRKHCIHYKSKTRYTRSRKFWK